MHRIPGSIPTGTIPGGTCLSCDLLLVEGCRSRGSRPVAAPTAHSADLPVPGDPGPCSSPPSGSHRGISPDARRSALRDCDLRRCIPMAPGIRRNSTRVVLGRGQIPSRRAAVDRQREGPCPDENPRLADAPAGSRRARSHGPRAALAGVVAAGVVLLVAGCTSTALSTKHCPPRLSTEPLDAAADSAGVAAEAAPQTGGSAPATGGDAAQTAAAAQPPTISAVPPDWPSGDPDRHRRRHADRSTRRGDRRHRRRTLRATSTRVGRPLRRLPVRSGVPRPPPVVTCPGPTAADRR